MTTRPATPAEQHARDLDQFHTQPAVVELCLAELQARIDPRPGDVWIEPSAGAGAFLERLPQPRIGVDIDPAAPGIERVDFLTWTPPDHDGRIIVVGNPPYGRNAAKAVAFFNRCASFAETIAFIVPRSFEKASIQARLDRAFHLVTEVPIPDAAFAFCGRIVSVPATFQIWERRDVARAIAPVERNHPDYAYCSPEDAVFAVQRVGANAGRVKTDLATPSPSSHYFLRATGCDAAELEARFRQIDFHHVRARTAGCPSISKTEILELYLGVVQLQQETEREAA